MAVHSWLMRHARKVPRHEFALTATLYPARGEIGTSVIVRNISTLGCQLEHAKAPSTGKNCELYFEWRGMWVGLEAKVVWKDAEGRMGLKFVKVDENSQRCLRELCASLHSQTLTALRVGDADAAGSVPDSAKTQGVTHSMAPPVAATEPPLRTDSERSHRMLPRYVSELRGQVMSRATGVIVDISLVDLSVAGARLEGTRLPDAGQTCEVHTEWEGRRMVLRGDVVWKSRKQVGVKFSSFDEETAKLLRRICANLTLVPPAP
jgi:hypothetical protein